MPDCSAGILPAFSILFPQTLARMHLPVFARVDNATDTCYAINGADSFTVILKIDRTGSFDYRRSVRQDRGIATAMSV